MYCYRRYGHNEGDEPRFTQPVMYAAIDKQPTVREIYVRRSAGARLHHRRAGRRRSPSAGTTSWRPSCSRRVAAAYVPPDYSMGGVWTRLQRRPRRRAAPRSTTAVPKRAPARRWPTSSASTPDDFNANPKVKRFLKERRERGHGEKPLDWGTAEALAFASLLDEGTRVRLSGQDARRGTFSHRHAVLFDAQTGRRYMPLMHVTRAAAQVRGLGQPAVRGRRARLRVRLQPRLPRRAGDLGGAVRRLRQRRAGHHRPVHQLVRGQVAPPQRPRAAACRTASRARAPSTRARASSASSRCPPRTTCRSCNLTTPAQIFHCLRRQVLRPWRKPLVIMTPKSLLRHPDAASTLDDLASGSFQRIIPDRQVDPQERARVLLCTGKVYYDLLAARTAAKRDGRRHRPPRAALPAAAAARASTCSRPTRTAPTSCGCRKSRGTAAPGTS